MSKTSSVFVRVEPEVKEQAETVLSRLGIPMSSAISMFLKQVVLQRGIPFEMKLPEKAPLALEALSEEEFNLVMEEGIADYASGRVTEAGSISERIRKGLPI